MAGPDLVHVDRQLGKPPDECARRAGVVEVDVREEDRADVAQAQIPLAQSGFQRRQHRRRARVHERDAAFHVEEAAGEDAVGAEEREVEGVDGVVGHAAGQSERSGPSGP